MNEIIKIKEILSTFRYDKKFYVLFLADNDDYEFLYFNHPKKNLRALFYGQELAASISSLLKNNDGECIECRLGSRIKGGVSLDGDDKVEFNFTTEKSNMMLVELKKKLKKESENIQLFL